jgi:arylamine N-acetyltransferase
MSTPKEDSSKQEEKQIEYSSKEEKEKVEEEEFNTSQEYTPDSPNSCSFEYLTLDEVERNQQINLTNKDGAALRIEDEEEEEEENEDEDD